MERAHYEELARKNNLLYRMLCYVALSVSKLNERVQKYKDKIKELIQNIDALYPGEQAPRIPVLPENLTML
jgi:hypothetical protein